FAEQVAQLPGIAVHGLMTMGPVDATDSMRRGYFEKMVELREGLNKITQARYLSMGMSNDYELAIECGANIVRVGRGIFGK
ncbi:MAG: alanine racemase, partial [Defluviitaleaceae bacterium]|nr:alanine racemase [Defluviitaleaceae bacterium]